MIWLFLYIVIGAIAGYRLGDEDLHWLVFVVLWPLFAIIFGILFFIDLAGFKIH